MSSNGAAVIIAIARPKPGAAAEVAEVLKDVVAAVHSEPGVVLYTINQAEDGTIYFIEKWESLDDARFHGANSAVMPVLAEKTRHLLEGPPEVIELTPIPAGDADKGAL